MNSKNDNQIHEWDEWSDHAWLATDSKMYVAFVTCADVNGLPHHLSIQESLMTNLRCKLVNLSILSDITPDSRQRCDSILELAINKDICNKYIKFIQSIGFGGLFVYDYRRNGCGEGWYECLVAPTSPINSSELREELRSLAEMIKVDVVFGETLSAIHFQSHK